MQTKLFTNALASPRVVRVLKSFVPALDRNLLRLSRGYVNTAFQPVALVKTIGAKSGTLREIATICMPVDGALVLVGSNWGADKDPAWIHNLRAHPEVRVAFRGYVGRVRAREVMGAEREELWTQLVAYNPQYAIYQAGTSRQLPIVMLEKLD